jgi:hypothetical protein
VSDQPRHLVVVLRSGHVFHTLPMGDEELSTPEKEQEFVSTMGEILADETGHFSFDTDQGTVISASSTVSYVLLTP